MDLHLKCNISLINLELQNYIYIYIYIYMRVHTAAGFFFCLRTDICYKPGYRSGYGDKISNTRFYTVMG